MKRLLAEKEEWRQKYVGAAANIERLRRELNVLSELHAAAERECERLRAALKLTEFDFNHARCPVCAGFDGEWERDKEGK